MTVFTLPEFYLSVPARRNRYEQPAREHSHDWARRMGMLDARTEAGRVLWDQVTLEAGDHAARCAVTHPDCDRDTLGTITDWYLWLSFLADHFPERHRYGGDLVSARAYLDRLESYLTGPGPDRPEPTDPVEAGLSDLWARTVPAMPDPWRERFARAIRARLSQTLRALVAEPAPRPPDPIEYLERQRAGGEAAMMASLVEYAVGARIGDALAGAAPVRTLREVFADALTLRADLFTDPAEGGPAGAVAVLERFLDVPAQQAADLAGELLTARLHRFEELTATAIPVLLAERAAAPGEARAVIRYAEGLRDWMAGDHEWRARVAAVETERAEYPRITRHGVLPYGREVGHLSLPTLYMPYLYRESAHRDRARTHSLDWAAQVGLFEPVLGVAGALWSPQLYAGFDLAHLASMIHADAEPEQLELTADWLTWIGYGDDLIPARYARRADYLGARTQLARLALYLPLDGSTPPPAGPPVERALSDLWRRTAGPLSPAVRAALRAAVTRLTAAWLTELENVLGDRVPDPVDYVTLRRDSRGAALSMALARLAAPEPLPELIGRSPVLRQLEQAAADYAGLTNDLYSYQKEIQYEDEVHNMVYVTERFLDCDRVTARDVVADLMTERMRHFERLVAVELPARYDEYHLDPATRRQLGRYVQGLQEWMAGTLRWHDTCARYSAGALVTRFRPGSTVDGPGPVPDGLGMAAARILQTIGGGRRGTG